MSLDEKIDRRSFVPLYYQLASILRSQIHSAILSGDFNTGNLLPSERELMRLYNVSRNTVRKAIQKLVQEGVIYSEHGEGNYIVAANFVIQCRIDIFVEHSELLKRAGYTPECRLIDSEEVMPDELICEKLGVNPTDPVRRSRKVFYADGRPAVYTVDFISLQDDPKGYQTIDDGQAFFTYLEDQRGLRVEFILSDMFPIVATGEVAEHLSLDVGTPLMMMHDIFLDPSQKKPIAFAKNHYRTDVLHFSILRRRD